ncbi:unnamed protein product [Trichogramma brassicae]|uniref:Uncharacterized protein n=1 Tax=Trichogramma brassicae TaxID=86971 RepID=A0A6H5IDU7_9HYME|nr:unnamed protein product [Trichogramma brassicae]
MPRGQRKASGSAALPSADFTRTFSDVTNWWCFTKWLFTYQHLWMTSTTFKYGIAFMCAENLWAAFALLSNAQRFDKTSISTWIIAFHTWRDQILHQLQLIKAPSVGVPRRWNKRATLSSIFGVHGAAGAGRPSRRAMHRPSEPLSRATHSSFQGRRTAVKPSEAQLLPGRRTAVKSSDAQLLSGRRTAVKSSDAQLLSGRRTAVKPSDAQLLPGRQTAVESSDAQLLSGRRTAVKPSDAQLLPGRQTAVESSDAQLLSGRRTAVKSSGTMTTEN